MNKREKAFYNRLPKGLSRKEKLERLGIEIQAECILLG